MNNQRIETYIILGIYFAIGLMFGYFTGKDSVKKDYLNAKTTQAKGGTLCGQN